MTKRFAVPLIGAATIAAAALFTTPINTAAAGTPPTPGTQNHGFQFSLGGTGTLGVQVTSMTDELRTYFGAKAGEGILVQKVEPNSPADKAGVRVGDVIAKVDGDSIDGVFDVHKALSDNNKGDKITIEVLRARSRVPLSATLDNKPSRHAFSFGKGFQFGNGTGIQIDPGLFGGQKWGALPAPNHMPRHFQNRSDRLEKLEKRLEKQIERLQKRLDKLERR